MNIEQEIRAQIEKNKGLKLAVGEINNHLSILEGLLRNEKDDVQKQVNEAYQKGYDKGYADKTNNDEVGKELAKDVYQRGLDDAWECTKKIADMWNRIDDDELLAIFGIIERIEYSTINSLFGKQTANEAIEKLKAYEEKQKADDEIRVGDEVKHERGWTAVVTWIFDDRMTLMGKDGTIADYHISDKFTKTGRHFDIMKILKEMQT